MGRHPQGPQQPLGGGAALRPRGSSIFHLFLGFPSPSAALRAARLGRSSLRRDVGLSDPRSQPPLGPEPFRRQGRGQPDQAPLRRHRGASDPARARAPSAPQGPRRPRHGSPWRHRPQVPADVAHEAAALLVQEARPAVGRLHPALPGGAPVLPQERHGHGAERDRHWHWGQRRRLERCGSGQHPERCGADRDGTRSAADRGRSGQSPERCGADQGSTHGGG